MPKRLVFDVCYIPQPHAYSREVIVSRWQLKLGGARTIPSISKGLPLFIECPLVLHPCPEVRNTPDLLAVEVRNGIRHRLARRVDAILLYSSEKVLFFLHKGENSALL